MKKQALLLTAALALATLPLTAQSQAPLSPPAKATATIAGSTITVDYAAPSMRERKIMGELVPFGKVWRTGANAATVLTTSSDLTIGDLHVPAGSYSLFTIPGEKEWTLIVNKQTGQWGTRHDASQDLGRVPMKVNTLDSPMETFTIAIAPAEGKKARLVLAWETTEASVPLSVR
jgi:hypothetical protein